MKSKSLLVLQPDGIPPEGLTLAGQVTLAELDIPEDDRRFAATAAEFQLSVSLVRGGILVQGMIQDTFRCRCDRCLTFFDQPLAVPAVCHFYKPVGHEEIDLTADLREDMLLAFPQRQLCREDCRGLCARCGQNLNVRECGCEGGDAAADAWGALDRLGFEADEASGRES
ncbi:MAG: hypothetical protein BWZ02_00436 [Lentisphaerae bacterium ADurb.BinA184]|nr:MAG: hypothetical protein BWZ02_00436 [Lentisphaerae bacterium ADurb.BinA184]